MNKPSANHGQENKVHVNRTANSSPHAVPKSPRIPSRFIACVRTAESAKRLSREVEGLAHPVTVLQDQNVRAIEEADYILLGCQPQDLQECIGSPSILRALQGKLLVSILAGVSVAQIEALLDQGEEEREGKPREAAATITNGASGVTATRHAIVRAMPNTASMVQASTTVITTTVSHPGMRRVVNWLFSSIGSVTYIPASAFDACTALCGSTPAFFALFLEALVEGAVNLGLKRNDARVMAAETMKGTAQMVLGGEHPTIVREKVTTPGGSTIKGIHKLEEGRLRAIVASALMECTRAAEALGAGKDI